MLRPSMANPQVYKGAGVTPMFFLALLFSFLAPCRAIDMLGPTETIVAADKEPIILTGGIIDTNIRVPAVSGTPIGIVTKLATDYHEESFDPTWKTTDGGMDANAQVVLQNCFVDASSCGSDMCVSISMASALHKVWKHNGTHVTLANSFDNPGAAASFCMRSGFDEIYSVSFESVDKSGYFVEENPENHLLGLTHLDNITYALASFSFVETAKPMCVDANHCVGDLYCYHQYHHSLCYPKRQLYDSCQLDKHCIGGACDLILIGSLFDGVLQRTCMPPEGTQGA